MLSWCIRIYMNMLYAYMLSFMCFWVVLKAKSLILFSTLFWTACILFLFLLFYCFINLICCLELMIFTWLSFVYNFKKFWNKMVCFWLCLCFDLKLLFIMEVVLISLLCWNVFKSLSMFELVCLCDCFFWGH